MWERRKEDGVNILQRAEQGWLRSFLLCAEEARSVILLDNSLRECSVFQSMSRVHVASVST